MDLDTDIDIHIYIYIYSYIHTDIDIVIDTELDMRTCICIYIYICTSHTAHACVFMCFCTRRCMSICRYLCTSCNGHAESLAFESLKSFQSLFSASRRAPPKSCRAVSAIKAGLRATCVRWARAQALKLPNIRTAIKYGTLVGLFLMGIQR